jgi:hypothetical protein
MTEQCTQYVEAIVGGGFADGTSRFCSLLSDEVPEDYANKYCKTPKYRGCSDLLKSFTLSEIKETTDIINASRSPIGERILLSAQNQVK